MTLIDPALTSVDSTVTLSALRHIRELSDGLFGKDADGGTQAQNNSERPTAQRVKGSQHADPLMVTNSHAYTHTRVNADTRRWRVEWLLYRLAEQAHIGNSCRGIGRLRVALRKAEQVADSAICPREAGLHA